MLRPLVTAMVSCSLFTAGCSHLEPARTSFFRRQGWWERRMDRLDAWDLHHGHVIDRAKDNTVAVVGYTLLGVAMVSAIVYETCHPEDEFPQGPLFHIH